MFRLHIRAPFRHIEISAANRFSGYEPVVFYLFYSKSPAVRRGFCHIAIGHSHSMVPVGLGVRS